MGEKQEKGTLLEAVVASLHESPGVVIKRNVKLPAKGSRRRTREIDVLVTAQVIGYPVTFAIECKNYDKVIGSPKIDEFIGKLDDVGIPTQMGIYVATKGYTKDAIERAEKSGLQLLLLRGLNDDGLSSKLFGAIQSVIYLLPIVTSISISNMSETAGIEEDLALFNERNEFCGTVTDLIWHKWLNGKPQSMVGQHDLEIKVPIGWKQIIKGKEYIPIAIRASVFVRGYVIALSGHATEHHLVNAFDNKVKRILSETKFDLSEDKYPLQSFDTEEALHEFLSGRTEKIKVAIGRVRLPRLQLGNIYWPISQRVQVAIAEFIKTNSNTEVNVSTISNLLKDIEGNDLATIWDPI